MGTPPKALSGPRSRVAGGTMEWVWPGRVRGSLGASSSQEIASTHSRVNGSAVRRLSVYDWRERGLEIARPGDNFPGAAE